jgi:hypothetical protein
LRPSEIISSGSTDWLVTTTPLHTIQLWLSTEIPCPKIVDALRQTILFDLLFLFLTIILLLSVQRFIIEPGRSPNNASQEKDAPSHPPTDEESSDSSTTDHNT